MCMANIYLEGESDKPILTEIAYLKLDGKQIEVATLLGESKIFQGEIKEIDFLSSQVVMKDLAD